MQPLIINQSISLHKTVAEQTFSLFQKCLCGDGVEVVKIPVVQQQFVKHCDWPSSSDSHVHPSQSLQVTSLPDFLVETTIKYTQIKATLACYNYLPAVVWNIVSQSSSAYQYFFPLSCFPQSVPCRFGPLPLWWLADLSFFSLVFVCLGLYLFVLHSFSVCSTFNN